MTGTIESLTAFAKANPPNHGGTKCWVCGIPEVEALNEGRRSGLTYPVLREWLLRECGYSPEEATPDRVRGHFQQGRHHERTK